MAALAQRSHERKVGGALTLLVHVLILAALLFLNVKVYDRADESPLEMSFVPIAPPSPELAQEQPGLRLAPESGGSAGRIEPLTRPVPDVAPSLPPTRMDALPSPVPSVQPVSQPPPAPVTFESAPAGAVTSAETGNAGGSGTADGIGTGEGSGAGAGTPQNLAASWIVRPSVAMMRRFYPLFSRASGSVVLSCRIERDYRVRLCNIVSETPRGSGFADAAIRASRSFRIRPNIVGGVPQYRSRVRVVVPFVYGNGGDQRPSL